MQQFGELVNEMTMNSLDEVKAFVSELTGVPTDCLGVRKLPENDLWVASESIRGGLTLLVDADRSVLYFHRASIPLNEAVTLFENGRRTDSKRFDKLRENNEKYWADPNNRQAGRDRIATLAKRRSDKLKSTHEDST